MQVLRPHQTRAWTKGKPKGEILRQSKTIFPNGIKLGKLSNSSVEPVGNVGRDGHEALGESYHTNQKPPSCFLNLMTTPRNHWAQMPRYTSVRPALIKQLFNEKSSSPLKMVERSYKLEKTTVQQEILSLLLLRKYKHSSSTSTPQTLGKPSRNKRRARY